MLHISSWNVKDPASFKTGVSNFLPVRPRGARCALWSFQSFVSEQSGWKYDLFVSLTSSIQQHSMLSVNCWISHYQIIIKKPSSWTLWPTALFFTTGQLTLECLFFYLKGKADLEHRQSQRGGQLGIILCFNVTATCCICKEEAYSKCPPAREQPGLWLWGNLSVIFEFLLFVGFLACPSLFIHHTLSFIYFCHVDYREEEN